MLSVLFLCIWIKSADAARAGKREIEDLKSGTPVLFDPKSTLPTLPSYDPQTPLIAASAARSLSIMKFYDRSARNLNAFFIILILRGEKSNKYNKQYRMSTAEAQVLKALKVYKLKINTILHIVL